MFFSFEGKAPFPEGGFPGPEFLFGLARSGAGSRIDRGIRIGVPGDARAMRCGYFDYTSAGRSLQAAPAGFAACADCFPQRRAGKKRPPPVLNPGSGQKHGRCMPCRTGGGAKKTPGISSRGLSRIFMIFWNIPGLPSLLRTVRAPVQFPAAGYPERSKACAFAYRSLQPQGLPQAIPPFDQATPLFARRMAAACGSIFPPRGIRIIRRLALSRTVPGSRKVSRRPSPAF